MKTGLRLSASALFTLFASASFATCDPADPSQQSYCLLSEVGGCANLEAFIASKLDPLANHGIYPATLIVDSQCTLTEPLVLPRRLTLAGVGIGGEGALVFSGIDDSQSALSVQDDTLNPGTGAEVTIRDISIYGPGATRAGVASGIGLNLQNDHQVVLERTRISNFNYGIFARNSFSVSIANSNISTNNYNLMLRGFTNTWRVRDSILSQAQQWSVYVQNSNDVLFAGNRFESNAQGGIFINSDAVFVQHNRFELNGADASYEGVRVNNGVASTRILTNLFSTSTVTDFGAPGSTICEFNVVDPAFLLGC